MSEGGAVRFERPVAPNRKEGLFWRDALTSGTTVARLYKKSLRYGFMRIGMDGRLQ